MSGLRRWPRICPFCGETYILTNWMRRWPWGFAEHKGRNEPLSDTHLIGCHKRLAAAQQEERTNG